HVGPLREGGRREHGGDCNARKASSHGEPPVRIIHQRFDGDCVDGLMSSPNGAEPKVCGTPERIRTSDLLLRRQKVRTLISNTSMAFVALIGRKSACSTRH